MKNAVNVPGPTKPDADLVVLAQQGDSDAFAALFNNHKAKVYSICLRMTSNSAQAEDLTQDVFLHVFRKLGTFRRDSAFSTWIYRVTVNTVLMYFRKKNPGCLSLDEPINHASGTQAREYGDVDDELTGVPDRVTVSRALKALPAGYRTVFVLHEISGYEHHDIARLLRCSIGTSKSQLHKAKAKLRDLLKRDKKHPWSPTLNLPANSRSQSGNVWRWTAKDADGSQLAAG